MKLRRLQGPVLSWESQVNQYPQFAEPGIGYFAGEVGRAKPVDCLLWRDVTGRVRGILNHYPIDMPPWERAGNINLWVHPDWQRQGIGTALLTEAATRWGPFDPEQQQYTEAGEAFARHLIGEEAAT